MRLYALKLSQPTVFALKLFILLIVMNLEQVRCNKIHFLYHASSQSFLRMYANGTVRTELEAPRTDKHCMVLSTVPKTRHSNDTMRLTIYNPATKLYLCINKKGFPVGRRRDNKNCRFYEKFDANAFTTFNLTKDNLRHTGNLRNRLLAFDMHGLPQKAQKMKRFTQFMKMDPDRKKRECACYQREENETKEPTKHRNKKRHKKP